MCTTFRLYDEQRAFTNSRVFLNHDPHSYPHSPRAVVYSAQRAATRARSPVGSGSKRFLRLRIGLAFSPRGLRGQRGAALERSCLRLRSVRTGCSGAWGFRSGAPAPAHLLALPRCDVTLADGRCATKVKKESKHEMHTEHRATHELHT